MVIELILSSSSKGLSEPHSEKLRIQLRHVYFFTRAFFLEVAPQVIIIKFSLSLRVCCRHTDTDLHQYTILLGKWMLFLLKAQTSIITVILLLHRTAQSAGLTAQQIRALA